jgi:flagellar biosynthesis protein FlhF
MRLKSFDAPTLSQAMALVRAELGDEAILVSTEKVGGLMRVLAAVEADDLSTADVPDPVEDVHEALVNHGVLPRLAERLLESAAASGQEDATLALAGAIDAQFAFAPIGEGRALMLVGPPGSGKTTSAAKIATRAVLDGTAVRLVTTDTSRAGAVEQLGAFARLLGIELHCAATAAELAEIAGSPAEDELVVVDTGGINPYLAGDREELAALAAAVDADLVLVMAAGGDVYDTVEMARVFAELGCTGLVATRVDMVHRLGSVLAAAAAARLAFAGLGVGTDIAEGLARPTPLSLARLLVPEAAAARTPSFQLETEAATP